MILAFAVKRKKTFACLMLGLMYLETVLPAHAIESRYKPGIYTGKGFLSDNSFERSFTRPAPVTAAAPLLPPPAVTSGGPTQPESQAFHSVNSDNMVDLFTGDFSYSIPLVDIGGYPLAIGYNSGIGMDQEASWVGLGWNINPGSITRNLRGLPDDFNGRDSVVKTSYVKENKTVGASGGMDAEVVGLPVRLGGSIGVFHNTYRGWGLESSFNASINAGKNASGPLSGGLSLSNNSQEGFSVSPTISAQLFNYRHKEMGGVNGSMNIGLSYNSRSGLKSIQYSGGISMYRNGMKKESAEGKQKADDKEGSTVQEYTSHRGGQAFRSSNISFNTPSFTPSMDLPFTSKMFTAMVKVGLEATVFHPNIFASGYVTKQYIADEDTIRHFPAYGYLNYQHGAANSGSLLDFNREKEIPYREKTGFHNIAIPSYTYDVFSVSGEGNGGMFRAYRSDIGYVHDHSMRSKDGSASASVDLGIGNLAHVGVDISETRAYTQNGPWRSANPLASLVKFTKPDRDYEAVYFRNPGEKTINTDAYYKAIGGTDVVRPKLYQAGRNSPNINTTTFLTRYRGEAKVDDIHLTAANTVKKTRDKRTQVISYLTAEDASVVGFPKYIENYGVNKYLARNCESDLPGNIDEDSLGFRAEYYRTTDFTGQRYLAIDTIINYADANSIAAKQQQRWNFQQRERISIRWTGRIKAPVSGVYKITLTTDDGVDLKVNDSSIYRHWTDQAPNTKIFNLNLEAGQLYDVRLDWYQNRERARIQMQWECNGVKIQLKDMFLPSKRDTFEVVPDVLSKEKRVNAFRKNNHISQIDVLNNDGRRYVYGLPVYNLKHRETTFAVRKENGNAAEGLVNYTHGVDNTTKNRNGQDHSFNSEEIPSFAHTFLLTGVVTPDYVDITGDGISDDDPGDAIKFNYTKTAGIKNPYQWRTPYTSKAHYNEGLKTDGRDDKGNYIYGEKELWYLNSIESKNMVATFKLGDRLDMAPIYENGVIDSARHVVKKLEEINLYTKADFLKYNTKATPVKTVHFEYTYELCPGAAYPGNNTGKLTLKRIWFSYNGNKKGKKNAYVFNYNSNNPSFDQKSTDRWGNYKDPLQNPGSSAGNLITNAEFPYAVQDSAIAAGNVAAWTLDSIQLPSGGRMKVTYESDDYAFVQNKRAAQMMQVAGFSFNEPQTLNSLTSQLFDVRGDYQYVAIHVPEKVSSRKEVYYKYLEGMERIFFRLNVQMPADKWGNGYEFVSGYAKLDRTKYGFINDGNTIWVKMIPIDKNGEDWKGNFSSMAKTAASFLRLNLPSKAYPGSDIGDNLDLQDGIQLLFSMGDNIVNAFRSFDATSRNNKWARDVDLSRSTVRLHQPAYKKVGGGLRVKRVVIYDHWNAMTKQKESMYGTEYSYTTIRKIDGVKKEISSGVATYEPMLGGEENPLREPLEYTQQVGPLAPVSVGYVEKPLGETFMPGASVGYSKVRTRSIKTEKTRSANGYDETCFYTAYDFPVIVEFTKLDPESKLRHKPSVLAKFLSIEAKHYLVLSQGFKIELNDMHGKLRSKASYAETDKENPITYSENFYHVDNQQAEHKHLSNTVLSMNAGGEIDSSALIGMDMELMMDMREQRTVSEGRDINVNVDIFTFGLPPILGIPSLMYYPQRQENLFRSAAATKVINRHGILDSMVVIDKGSKLVTHNMLFDAETGDVLLTATQNEHNDTIYQFTYPAGWVYDGMSGAYKNINTLLQNVNIREGRIITNLGGATAAGYFATGDEILVQSRNMVAGTDCGPTLATWRSAKKIWAVDANAMNGNPPEIFFMDQDGKPFTGNDVIMKVIRSGRKNIGASAGAVSMLGNPLVKNGNRLELKIDKDSRILNASMVEFRQNWQVDDRRKEKITCDF